MDNNGLMGYSRPFIDKIKTLYNTCEMQIMNGGASCGVINGTNSVRQGCPLSMHLFVIYLEPLIAKLETCLSGMKVGTTSVKLQAYVDDLTVVITNDVELKTLEKFLNDFCRCFGASVNKSKTMVMGLGIWKGRVNWPLHWLAPSEILKLIGIEFTPLLKETRRINWERVNGHIIGILTKNATRNLSIEQRNRFIKAFCLSRAIYVAKILACPKEISDKILTETQRFL